MQAFPRHLTFPCLPFLNIIFSCLHLRIHLLSNLHNPHRFLHNLYSFLTCHYFPFETPLKQASPTALNFSFTLPFLRIIFSNLHPHIHLLCVLHNPHRFFHLCILSQLLSLLLSSRALIFALITRKLHYLLPFPSELPKEQARAFTLSASPLRPQDSIKPIAGDGKLADRQLR